MPNQLTLDERITITDLRHQDLGPTEIGRRIGRPASTITREIGRNSDAAGHYHYTHAQQQHDQRRSTASARSWTRNAPLLAYVRKGIRRHWSPEQISGRLGRLFPRNPRMWTRRWDAGRTSPTPTPPGSVVQTRTPTV